MDLTDEQTVILDVLAVQSPGYDAYPNASCFVAVGFEDAEHVAELLQQLEAGGAVQQFVYDVVLLTALEVYENMTPEQQAAFNPDEGELPEPVLATLPGGFEILDAGRILIGG